MTWENDDNPRYVLPSCMLNAEFQNLCATIEVDQIGFFMQDLLEGSHKGKMTKYRLPSHNLG